ncbi:DMT family transporter [Blastochloris viridis]|uniref:Permease of the drug/metabolite transporter superfamily n=1 Tax=Blastochloris viridis TaxID=1079 RepID=A0A0H5B957_BLAVI|nr:DMT family transporter [Blastochloris viridis]ALK07999.1 putative amino-acid metabolite efflux pump [Blastochloris viridis]BAR98745.1 permease of the drug/metabolite transporter superfamily [Blastochloris viridis]CUU43921.1 putative amino-acid metabolite efflux pump [Blastochloris viridis]
MTPVPTLNRLAPFTFVLIWSTGWIVARAIAPYADPLTFLALRYTLAGLCLAGFALLVSAPWPRRPAEIGHGLVSGILIHAIYLGGVWWAIANGVPAGISALIAALQPIMTAVLAPWLTGERIRSGQWFGIALGFLGIVLVVTPKIAATDSGQLGAVVVPLAINVAAMLSVTLGTLYQKRFVATGDLRTTTVIQYVGALIATVPAAMLMEEMRFEVNLVTVGWMAWSVLAISIGAVALLLLLIRRGAVARAAALIYLVPPAAAVQAYLLFGETLTGIQLAGMALTAIGVWRATRH